MNEPYDAEMNMMRTEKVFIFYVKERPYKKTQRRMNVHFIFK